MDYRDVITDWLRAFNDEHIISPEDLTGNEPIPTWWAEVTGPNGGRLLAEKWDQLAPADLFPQTKVLLRSERTLGAVILRSHPGGNAAEPPIWNLAVALDYLPNEASQGPIIFRFEIPLKEAEVPPWWEFFPPALRLFFLNAHRDLNEGVLTMPGSPESTLLASDRFSPDHPEEMCAFQPCPDPRELVIVATNPSDQLYLDIGQQTYQGWEVPGDHDERGGPRPVSLLDTIDAYLVLDRPDQEGLPSTNASEAPSPAPLRPRNLELDWPSSPFWQRG